MSRMDGIDRRLMAALQRDNRTPISDLCSEIGLTAPTCHRRLKRLRTSGVISKETALVDPALGTRPLTVLIELSLERLNDANRRRIERKFAQLKEISLCWAVAGDADFFAVGQFRDMSHYYAFANSELVEDEDIKRHRTMFGIQRLKCDLEVEF